METHAMKLLHTVFMLMLVPEEVLTYSIISVLDFDALFALGDLLCNILCGVPFCGQVLWFLNTSILQYYSLQLIVEYKNVYMYKHFYTTQFYTWSCTRALQQPC